MTTPVLYGLVLIGGQSSRMGADKSLIRYYENDQREHNFELLKHFCSKVYLSCHSEQTASTNLPFIEDITAQAGPLTGIISAFTKHPTVAWLAVACDMPYINEELLQKLVQGRNAKKLATCFYHDFPEPLCTIWEPTAFIRLQQFIQAGNRSPKRFLESTEVEKILICNELEHSFKNFNTPEEKNSFGKRTPQ